MLSLKQRDSQEIIKKEQEIFINPAWHDLLVGVECEDLLKGKDNFSYLLRRGEARYHYYLSYVLEAPFIYKHQPFTITLENFKLVWGYRNGHTWWASTLEELIPLIVHQPLEKCIPILKNRP